jgi:enoyl-CoA hydratase/carnithine racemase
MVGPTAAMDLMLAGRTFLAEEAHRLGLVTRLSEPGRALTDATEYARELATHCAPRAMAVLKQAIYESLDQTYGEALETGAKRLAETRGWPEADEGVASYVERRPPNFPPLPGP